jgi:hypothetical protein
MSAGCAETERIASYDIPKQFAENEAQQQLLWFSSPPSWSRSFHDKLSQFAWDIDEPTGAAGRVTVTWLPPQGADIPSNVARWQRQLGLAEKDTPEVHDVRIGEETGALVELTSTASPSGEMITKLLPAASDTKSIPSGRVAILGAILKGEENAWAFKFAGDADLVAHERENFLRFLGRLKSPTAEVARGD